MPTNTATAAVSDVRVPGISKLTKAEARLWMVCMVCPGIITAVVFAVSFVK